MKITKPKFRILFESSQGELSTITHQEMSTYSIGVEVPIEFFLSESFGTIIVELEQTSSNGSFFTINGVNAKHRIIGQTKIIRFTLDRDIAFHRISIVSPPKFSATIDLVIEHSYRPAGLTGGLGIQKWKVDQFKAELNKHKILFLKAKQREVLPDEENSSTHKDQGKNSQIQLLFQIIGRLESTISAASDDEILVDFCKYSSGDLDREAILSAIKQDHHSLTPSENGLIAFKEKRYNTRLSRRRISRTLKVDLSSVTEIIDACSLSLRKSDAPAVLSFLLSALNSEIKSRFDYQETASDSPHSEVLERNMHSTFGSQLQTYLRTLIAVVRNIVDRDPIDSGLLWLKQSIQDRDVFQTSVFSCCGKAFNFPVSEILSSGGILRRGDIQIADTNSSAGLELFKRTVNSWRSDSGQPSDYRPDTFILYNDSPVIIDAKFRMPKSVWQVADPDGLKDVQAYMNDFQLNSAIVVVPRILNRDSVGPDGYAAIKGNSNVILVVEMQDSDALPTLKAMQSAIEYAARMAIP